MTRGRQRFFYVGLPAVLVFPLVVTAWRAAGRIGRTTEAHRVAVTYPDYAGIVIPPNLAPLNLKVLERGRRFCLRLSAGAGAPVEAWSSDGAMQIRPEKWRSLLRANAGGELRMDIYAKGEGGWVHFDTVRNRIAADDIDPYVVYRFIPPIYNTWGRISVRERNLTNFTERVVFDNQRSTDGDGRNAGRVCVNCHTFLNHRTAQMLLHVRPARSPQIPAMVLVRDGRAQKVDTRTGQGGAAGYSAWHPSGKLLVFSRNSFSQVFHAAGVETREVVDKGSDLEVYQVDTNVMQELPQISRPDRLETWPAWSPDGRYLYFCSASSWMDKKDAAFCYDKVQYDLNRIAYDPATGAWGEVETVVTAAQLGKSISIPQVSPDGRFLVFCGHPFGSFPVFQPGSDLYMLDLGRIHDGAAPRRLDEVNSDKTDSYHSWSSDSRWIIFASKREDGVFARLYIAHLEPGSRFSKPFVMPQEDPGFYTRTLMTYNRPEMTVEPVAVSPAELARAANSAASNVKGTNAAPSGGAPPGVTEEPWRH